MAFRFKEDESVAEGVRRMSEERIDRALGRLEQPDKLKAVHDVRKDIKKLRAILRLVRGQVGEKVYCEERQTLRDVAETLSATRDAQVKLGTLDNLIKHFQTEFSAHPLETVRKHLESDYRREAAHFRDSRSWEKAGGGLKKLGEHITDWQINADGWEALDAGLRKIYGSGRKAYQLLHEDTSAENFHQWRKRVKDLWYHLRMLCPAWPGMIEATAEEFKILGEHLGEHHDLTVLRDTMRDDLPKKDLKKLGEWIDQRQSELEPATMALGARIYVEKASDFSRRLGKYWDAWHDIGDIAWHDTA